MSEYALDPIIRLEAGCLNSGAYLWIWHANKIPPHLGLSINGRYFSLKHNGKDVGLPADQVIRVIEKKKIASLFAKIDQNIKHSILEEIFNDYTNATSIGSTCLTPIAQVFNKSDVQTVFEFLDQLNDEKKLISVSGLYLPEGYKGIPMYGVDEIRSRLLILENASFGKHIPSVG